LLSNEFFPLRIYQNRSRQEGNGGREGEEREGLGGEGKRERGKGEERGNGEGTGKGGSWEIAPWLLGDRPPGSCSLPHSGRIDFCGGGI